ncbi:hypothetical protein QJS10_CPB20g01686 [Acorus calamus]|uniref:Uncharacterized protein n=1 Tax=Acorus calamus TaxID=4465 RepID=A0AAV9CAU6_ACOCL|nr:hypothetical protein QJS10_CPB20g01686 [Acorus calamus]
MMRLRITGYGANDYRKIDPNYEGTKGPLRHLFSPELLHFSKKFEAYPFHRERSVLDHWSKVKWDN